MGKGVNKVILVGNLGADPEVRYTNSGTAICTFTLATSDTWVDKQSGERQERTEWHRVKAFGKLGEICGEYLAKGRQAYIEGQIRTEKYTDKNGVEKYATDIIAAEVQFLGGGSEGGHGGQGRGGQQSRGGGHSDGRSGYGAGGRSGAGGGRDTREPESRQQESRQQAQGGDFSDDEIPF